jgi:fructose 1,6-bisphosphatase
MNLAPASRGAGDDRFVVRLRSVGETLEPLADPEVLGIVDRGLDAQPLGTARFDNSDRECEPDGPWRTRGRGIG